MNHDDIISVTGFVMFGGMVALFAYALQGIESATNEINKLMDQFNNRFDRIKKSMSELDAENEKPEQELGHKEVTKKSDQVLTEFKQGLITFLTDYIDNMLNIEPEEFVEANEEKLLALASKQLDIIVHNKAVDDEIKRRDLEKEIETHLKECLDIKFPTTDIKMIAKDVEYTARKFFELGLKAQKGE